LKLLVAGRRRLGDGSLDNVGSDGSYWSSSVDGANARGLAFGSSNADMFISYRAYGRSVRCLKDYLYAQKDYQLKLKGAFARFGESATVQVQTEPIVLSDSLFSYQYDLPIPEGLEFVSASLPDDTLRVSFATQSEYMMGDTVLTNIELKGNAFGAFDLKPANGYFNAFTVDSITPGVFNVVSLLKGDINEDSLILAHDAAMANWYSVGADPLPNQDPLPWDPWRIIVADVNNDGNVLADDASLILQKTVGLIDEFPNNGNKSASPQILVRAENNMLYFYTEDEGLIGANIYLPVISGVTYGEPEFLSEGALTASHQTEEEFNLGIATLEPMMGDFLQVPISAEPEGTLPVSAHANSSFLELLIDLSDVVTSIEEGDVQAQTYELLPNYPNPFNPSTLITYSLAEPQPVRIEVYAITGEKVATLVQEMKGAGTHSVTFDATGFSSGMYLYRMTTPEFTQTRSMMLIK
jgi:hypothetical protein